MATTYNNATGNGSNKDFTYTFPTIEETNTTANTNSEVKVALDGITQAANRYTVHTSPAKIQFNNTNGVDSTVQEADGAPKSAVKVRVYRDTGVDSASVVFAAGSSIRAQDLNTVADQGLYHSQEQQNQLILAAHIDEGAVTSVKIKDDTIVNADINSAAEIEVSKLKDGAARQVLQTAADGSTIEWTNNVDLPGTLDVTGATDLDGTLNVDGATTIQNNLIIKADNKEVAIQNASGTDKFTVDTDNGNTVIQGDLTIQNVGSRILSDDGATFAGDVNIGAANFLMSADNKTLKVQNASGVDKFTVDSDNGNTVIAGTLDVTSNVGIDGDFDINTNKFTVASATGNTVVAGTLSVTGNASFAGNVDLGDASSDTISMNGDVDTDLLPTPSGQNDLGNSSKKWNNCYANSFHGDGANLSNTGATLSAASGTQRLVLTSLTSGTMTTAATDGDLTFNAGTNTLTAGVIVSNGEITAFASDDRLKTNKVNIGNAVDKVKSLNGFTFNFNETGESLGFDPKVSYAGVSAQEVKKVLPEAVTTRSDGEYLTVIYEKLVPLLLEAVKELSAEVDQLKSQINN